MPKRKWRRDVLRPGGVVVSGPKRAKIKIEIDIDSDADFCVCIEKLKVEVAELPCCCYRCMNCVCDGNHDSLCMWCYSSLWEKIWIQNISKQQDSMHPGVPVRFFLFHPATCPEECVERRNTQIRVHMHTHTHTYNIELVLAVPACLRG